MNKMKTVDSEELFKKQLENDIFKKEYEKSEKEFLLAVEIIKLRKKANLTQKELAEKAGPSQPAIARLESGNYPNVSLSFLRKIGKALNVEPEIRFKSRAL